MAEASTIGTETQNPTTDPCAASSSSKAVSLFTRKIQFQPAKNPFKGFSSDFHLETLNPTTSEPRTPASASSPVAAAAAAAAKKQGGSEFSEYGLDPELSFGITFRRIGAGLRNLGNTCFLNSVLQCLTYTEPLAAYLQSGKHKTSCHIAGFCALCAIQNHVSRALQATGRILSPEDLVGNLRCISRNFRNARQEDAHEYMVNLLESMHKCCLPSGVPSESLGAYEKSFVHKIFGGRLRSQVKCQQCSYCSNKFDPFLDLSLEIFKADSLHKALANFTAAEWLDGGERQYNCQKCKQKVRALKQLTIHKAPYVLTIHLKRFYAHDPGQKIKKKVQFGCALDLKPFVSGSYDGDVRYSLYGVLVHSGSSTHSGHYYCYVRTSNNMWYTLDDNRVSHVSEREVLNQQAYMLFYVRDRKSIIPRKPVDIAKKENMKLNVNGNRDSTMSNHVLKEVSNGLVDMKLKVNGNRDSTMSNHVLREVSNGLVENKSSREPCLTVEAKKNISNVDSSRVPFMKDGLVQHKNCHSLAESLTQNTKPVSELISKEQEESLSQEGLSVANTELECLSSLDHSGKEHSLPNNVEGLVAPAGDNINKNGIAKEVRKESLPSLSAVSNPQTLVTHNTNGTSQSHKDNIVINVEASQDSSADISNNASHQVGVSANGSVCDEVGGIQHENATDCQGPVLDESMNRSLIKESLNQKRMRKSKKKLLKYHVSRMHLSSPFFFMAFLSLRKMNHKRRKHKRSKHHRLGLRTPNKGKVDKHDISSDVGPSTSGKADAYPCVSSCFESGAAIGGYRPGANFKSVGDTGTESSAEGEFRRRIDQNCAVLATTMQGENTSLCGSVAKQLEARHVHDSKRNRMHNNLMSMLTRGLEETVVASWDDIELPPSQFLESKKNDKTVTVGYVGDEWDEEYDKGKRKKLRGSKNSFGGPNLFQEIATEKSKLKRAKLDQSSSGNPPFRI